MIELLLKAKEYKETANLNRKMKTEIFTWCDQILSTALENEHALEELQVKKRGRKKRSDSVRLIDTFLTRRDKS